MLHIARKMKELDFRQLMDAVMEYQDRKTCLWYNVTDGREEFAYHKKTDTEDIPIPIAPDFGKCSWGPEVFLSGCYILRILSPNRSDRENASRLRTFRL